MINDKTIVKTLSIVSIFATIIVLVTYGVSSYTLGVSISESFQSFLIDSSSGESSTGLQMSGDQITGITIALPFTVKNPGFLEVFVTINLRFLTNGISIAESSDSKRIPPGLAKELRVDIFIPPEDFERVFNIEAEVDFSITLDYKTLFDMVGIAVSLQIEGEPLSMEL